LKDLEYLERINKMEPTESLISYLNENAKFKKEWMENLKELGYEIVNDKEITSYQKEVLLKRLDSYLKIVDKGRKGLDMGHISFGFIGLILGWFLRERYEIIEKRRERRIAELIMKEINSK
jgi:hypothetical protein